ncbi:hypothetical protein SAMN04488003_111108 [Loktanella fryxellensis]|uniref:Alpha/beta hydrolase family protein n=1 Tax=Loktanella fryxellensis TaxID=245187 RepID=A0A1H8EUF0_9RHOB|nr:alpha/beta hydrolase [Loktanella fryxellensis]SEN23113.1 hypothetical protein SAMN04488003_111108 [Loktanella fryxellensis]
MTVTGSGTTAVTGPLQRVFDGAHLRADLARNGGRRLIVTFDYRKRGRTGFGVPDPSRQFAAAGFDQLMIATQANDWFVNADLPALAGVCAVVRRDYAAARALGFSMGGYGALRLSGALALDYVTLVSPQVSIAPAVVPFDPRYRDEGRSFDMALGDLTPQASHALRGEILCDPCDAPDLIHARMIQALFPGLSLLRLTGGGHPCSQVLRATGRSGLLQRRAMDALPSARMIVTTHRQLRGGQACYWQALARAARVRRPHVAAMATARQAKLAAGTVGGVDADGDSA